jgi:hypothetical protein
MAAKYGIIRNIIFNGSGDETSHRISMVSLISAVDSKEDYGQADRLRNTAFATEGCIHLITKRQLSLITSYNSQTAEWGRPDVTLHANGAAGPGRQESQHEA